MKKTVVILQSSYIPWIGYFDLINSADEFIIYDDIFISPEKSWRVKNKVRNKKESFWLTIPIIEKKLSSKLIKEVEVAKPFWAKKHWKSISLAYSKAPYFVQYRSLLEKTFAECENLKFLSQINQKFIFLICSLLKIETKISFSEEYGFQTLKSTERLVEICKASSATTYLSGPAGKNYLKEDLFVQANIKLKYFDYSGYLPYPQLGDNFFPNLSILDTLLSVGEDTKKLMKSF